MKLIVGLGNPGREYDMTRHNAGFMVVDLLARRHAPGAIARSKFGAGLIEARIAPPGGGVEARCLLAQPTTYMNRSGRTVGEAVRFYKLDPAEDVLVITDDLALPVGAIRLRASGGAGGHNGLADIERVLGTDAYARLRVGIGAKPPGMNQADYVLSRFFLEERPALDEAIGTACDAVACWADEGPVAAMNRFNTKVNKPPKAPKPKNAPPKRPASTGPDPDSDSDSQSPGAAPTVGTGNDSEPEHTTQPTKP